MPDALPSPPVLAEPGDPFAMVRILDLLARVPRGRPVRIDDIAAALEARYLDWRFEREVVVAACVTLQANWFADYRNQSGIELAEGPYGITFRLEDTPRVDPWIARQAQRAAAECRAALVEFARADS
jgi:hypothetical protein